MAESADSIIHALSGGLGGAAALTVTYPLVAISCHQQTNKKNIQKRVEEAKKEAEMVTEERESGKKPAPVTQLSSSQLSALEIVRDIAKTEGLPGFYAGLESAIYGMALTNFVYYYFYESVGRFIIKNRGVKNPAKLSISGLKRVALAGMGPVESIVTGVVAGCITALATNPFWVLNTRTTVSKTNKSFFALFGEVYRKEGFSAFFSGVLPALVLVINPVIQYAVFEQIKNAITKRRPFKPIHAFFVGALTKLLATGSTYPYITVKSRMHLKGDKKVSMTQLLVSIVKNEGFAGLYNGIFTKLSQSILTAAFLFFFKEEFVNLLVKVLALIRRLRSRKAI